jgi:hypothetical protein
MVEVERVKLSTAPIRLTIAALSMPRSLTELRLLGIQKAGGIPYPDSILAWRKANAAAIAALEPQIEAEAGQ